MFNIIYEPPGEPINLKEVKDYLRISHDVEDAFIENLIKMGRSLLEQSLDHLLKPKLISVEVPLDKGPQKNMRFMQDRIVFRLPLSKQFKRIRNVILKTTPPQTAGTGAEGEAADFEGHEEGAFIDEEAHQEEAGNEGARDEGGENLSFSEKQLTSEHYELLRSRGAILFMVTPSKFLKADEALFPCLEVQYWVGPSEASSSQIPPSIKNALLICISTLYGGDPEEIRKIPETINPFIGTLKKRRMR